MSRATGLLLLVTLAVAVVATAWFVIERRALYKSIMAWYAEERFVVHPGGVWTRVEEGRISVGRWGGDWGFDNPAISVFTDDGSKIGIDRVDFLDHESQVFGVVNLGELLILDHQDSGKRPETVEYSFKDRPILRIRIREGLGETQPEASQFPPPPSK